MVQLQQVSEYIKKWGNSASISLLDPRCQFYSDPSVEGVIGYLEDEKYAVIFGDPVCAPENTSKLAHSFYQHSKEKDNHLIYLTASEKFARWAMDNGCKSLLEVEEELVIDPAAYPRKGSNGRLLHKKMNHAARAGVTLHEYSDDDEEIKQGIIQAEEDWLQARKGPQIYVSRINFFEDANGRRCFYALHQNKVVGVIYLSRLEAQQGWLLYLLMALPEAPGGTSESLVLFALDALAAEGCHFFSFGVSAAEKMGEIVGLGAISTWLARMGFRMAKKIFPLDNRRRFWEKFEPKNRRSFILFSRPSISYKEVKAILKTVNARL